MRKLIIITDSFPWGISERSFVGPELELLKLNYEVTIISRIPLKMRNDNVMAYVPSEIKVLHYPTPELGRKRKWIGFIRGLFSIEYLREMKRCLNDKKGIQSIKDANEFWFFSIDFMKWMKKHNLFDDIENTLFYSYWANISVLSLALQKKKMKNLRFFSRIHHYDLLNERFPGKRQPFKNLIDQYIDRIFFISPESLEYYKKHLVPRSKNNSKYRIMRLGVNAPVIQKQERYKKEFLVVSCSNIIPIKRVDMIIRTLADMNIPLYWIHFGSGKYEAEIRKMAQDLLSGKENIHYEFRGFTPNDDILKFYSKFVVDCFLTTTSSEGVPVSIQEAEAYGIPIIATDVGAVKSMIRDNGILLSANPTIEDVKHAIMSIYNLDVDERNILKNNSYLIWKEFYNFESNIKQFMKEIERI